MSLEKVVEKNSVQRDFTVFVSPLHDTDAASEERRAKKIEEMFSEIQSFVKQFASRLLDECIQVLGPAPEEVNYAFVGFGSFPRREVTPYSDIESALLIEEGKNTSAVKEYFVKLTEYFNFKVLNLQETILPSMSIASLNDLNGEINSLKSEHKCTATTCTNKENDDDPTASRENSCVDEDRDWFYDNQMRGFSVDGRMSKACKTPLGWLVKGRGRSEDLIKTPTEMAELYANSLKHDRDVSHERENNDYNLSTVLSNVSFLYGNDESLVDIYDGLVMSMTESTGGDAKLNPREASAVGCLRKALEEFQFSLNSSQIGLISSIKKKLYRVIDLLLVNLGKLQYPGVVENSPWNVLQRLNKDGRISSEAFHNLMVVASIVNEVRLMAYLGSGRQDELLSFLDESMHSNHELTKDLFLRFFYTVFPFQKAVSSILPNFLEKGVADAILFPKSEQFYEYRPLTSAFALSLTSHHFTQECKKKFEEALHGAKDKDTQRLCLAFLSCFHPRYSIKYCNELLAFTPSSEGDDSSDWRIFSFLVASLTSLHADDVENAEKFLAAATSESFRPGKPSRAREVVHSYEILVRGLLKLRQGRYEEALRGFAAARATYVDNTRSRGEEKKSEKATRSMFVICCDFMSGRCHTQLGNFEDSSMERAMCSGKVYTGNGQYMRILYHAYAGIVCLQHKEQEEVLITHCEKVIKLFLSFKCPTGQEPWCSIVAQGAVLTALFLGLLSREKGRIDDACRIFQLGSTGLISKALVFCEEKYHFGEKSFETAKMCVDALRAVFNLLDVECLHEKGNDEQMWTQLAKAVAQLAKYAGKFQPTTQSKYTIEQDVHRLLIRKGTPLISLIALMSSDPGLLERFQSNPCEVLKDLIPMMRQNPQASEIVREIFASDNANAQRTAMVEEMRRRIVDCVGFAVGFTENWIEMLLYHLRLSLCHDVIGAFGLFK